ncbi:MAG: CubicO group peptidase (beta-lactamase class C family) [Halieaceae bacterium]|jgi:CubicO group peptidase (beta-lactamase class C family)
MRLFTSVAILVLLQACKHPLIIVGEGDIVDLNGSVHGCTLVQFQAGDTACTENTATGDYFVNYQAVPKPGWRFVRWEGPCGHLSVAPACRIESPSAWVAYWDLEFSDTDIPATIAVFEPEDYPDFSLADAFLEDFVAQQDFFQGAAMVIVDKNLGNIHRAFFGNQNEDWSVLLASTSKVPTVMLLMALHEDDDNINFDITQPIANYLPWQGVWDENITTEHLVSNRSGIPGLLNVFIRPEDYLPHLCQFLPTGTLLECAEQIYTTPLPALEATPANTALDYGGSQWQLAGGVAETVGGASWNQLWDQYIGGPCELEVFHYGNNLNPFPTNWDGSPDSLVGLDNPNMEGGAMTTLSDYAKLISLHLNDGLCGENRVLSQEAVEFMRIERTEGSVGGRGYAMGWWTVVTEAGVPITLFVDPGFYGSVSWLDIERGYGGVVFLEEYSGVFGSVGSGAILAQLIPMIEDAIDASR